MRLSSNLPLNVVNSKKPRIPNVANRVDAFVMAVLEMNDKLIVIKYNAIAFI